MDAGDGDRLTGDVPDRQRLSANEEQVEDGPQCGTEEPGEGADLVEDRQQGQHDRDRCRWDQRQDRLVVIARAGVPAPQPDALLETLKTQLANYKIPKRCFVEAELPRNTMGKVQKNLLRERHKGLFA